MFKIIILNRRKEGISHEQYREHYENSHAKLGEKYYGHLWTKYKRNYVKAAFGGSPAPNGGFGPVAFGYDCITEWEFPSRAEYEELLRIAADPEIGKIFFEDEGHFLDRKSLVIIEIGDVLDHVDLSDIDALLARKKAAAKV